MDAASARHDGGKTTQSDASGGPSRRAVVTGLAWSVPVIALAAPVPAHAASGTVNGLEAAMKVWLTASGRNRSVDIMGRDPQHPADGYFRVTGCEPGQVISAMTTTVMINQDIADAAWSPINAVGDVTWNRPVKIAGPDADGFYTYRFTSKTASTTVGAPGVVALDAAYHFRAAVASVPVRARAQWSAVITQSTTPTLVAASTTQTNLSNDGSWVYLTSPAA